MDKEEIEKKVKGILADKLDISEDKISLDSDLMNDLGMDSFSTIEVVFEMEDKFGIDIPDDDISEVTKVKDIVDYLTKKVK